MRITFVNHASFIIASDSIRLMCDPWLEGPAFDNGWMHIAETIFDYADFSDITHIWFSHEHPDHFSPPNLKKIPEALRKQITILYQETQDQKIKKFCLQAGFKEVIELSPYKPHFLTPQFKALCNPFTHGDSYLLIDDGHCKLLNINDCILDNPEAIMEVYKQTGTVDILFTQFSYANKIGNTADQALRLDANRKKLERIRLQSKRFKPEYIVPFASFIWFCHAENQYMNDALQDLETVDQLIRQELGKKSVILYPGDSWQPGEPYDSSISLKKYLSDFKDLGSRVPLESASVPESRLIEDSRTFTQRLKDKNPGLKSLPTSYIHLSDSNKTYALNLEEGLKPQERAYESCDISLTSSALDYTFRFEWGGDTLNVNARYQCPSGGSHARFNAYTTVASCNNQGKVYQNVSLLKRALNKGRRMIFRLQDQLTP